MCFWLTFKRYPGSGTNLTRSDVYDMTWERLVWEWEMLQETWEAEANAVNGKPRRSLGDF